MPDLSTPSKSRDHAHSMAGTIIRAMPTIPASNAKDLPAGVSSTDVLWDETIDAGEYAGRTLKRGSRIRINNLEGDGCIALLLLNADHPVERLNVADTCKVQWNAYVGKGNLLLSDMGRVMASITGDTCGNHDTLCGASNEKQNAAKYGIGANYSPYPNARDRFLIALQKFGLGKKDIAPTINFFKAVKVNDDGSLAFNQHSSKPGDCIELRAEMNLLLVAVNAPHVLDPRPKYTATPVRLTAWRGLITPASDPIRNSTPEALRAFQNTEDYYNV
jgi:urea carboxylase-associated protein 2